MENTGKSLMHTQLALVLAIIHQSVCAGYVGSPLFIEGTVVSRNIYLVDREASRHQEPEIRLGSLVCTCSLKKKKYDAYLAETLSNSLSFPAHSFLPHIHKHTLLSHSHYSSTRNPLFSSLPFTQTRRHDFLRLIDTLIDE